MVLCSPKVGRNAVATLKNRQKNFYDIWFDFGCQKKKKTIVKNGQNARNLCKRMKFKIRLVAGNGIWSAKIRLEGPLNTLESTSKIL
jgi:hypothetical protein